MIIFSGLLHQFFRSSLQSLLAAGGPGEIHDPNPVPALVAVHVDYALGEGWLFSADDVRDEDAGDPGGGVYPLPYGGPCPGLPENRYETGDHGV
jgi:hypothetical protein